MATGIDSTVSTIMPIVVKFGVWIALGLVLLIVIGVIGLIAYFYNQNKSYSKHKVIVYERIRDDKGNIMPVILDRNEKGRIWYDKKMKKYFFELKNLKVKMGEEELKSYDEDRDLDVPHISYGSGGDICFVERLGVKKYAFGKAFAFEGDVKVIVSNADVAEAIRAYDMNAKTFGKKENQFWAFAFYMIIAVLVLILIIVILNKFDTLKEVASQFNAGANTMLQVKQAGVVSNAPT